MTDYDDAAAWRSQIVEDTAWNGDTAPTPCDHVVEARELAGVAERYRLAARATNDLIWDWDLSNGTVQWNEALKSGLGYGSGNLGTTAEWWLSCIHPQDVTRVSGEIHDALEGHSDQFASEYHFLRCDGSYADIYDRGYVIRDEVGCAIRMVGAMQDNTERNRALAEIRTQQAQLQTVLEASIDCIKIVDLNGRLQLMNRSGQEAIELDDFEKLRGADWASIWPAEGKPLVEVALKQAKKGEVSRFSGMLPTLTGVQKWWDVLVSPMCDERGEVTGILAISRDITAQRNASEQLKWASEHDGLTSLPNRRAFHARLHAAIIRSMDSGSSVGLLLIDLDHFKHVNDTLGHAAGDHLLTSLSDRLKDSVRARDFVARLGGDEFAVIIEGAADAEHLLSTGEAILSRLKHPINFDGRVMSASASIGGALFPANAQCANELFNNADSALYALKRAGRGGTRMFHQHMRQHAQDVASQLSLARSAISADTVEPHYQQKIELSTGKVKGFEALLRWRHPSRGIQQPDTVAEAFKDYELASKIGELMQCRVFSDVRRWHEQGLEVGVVAINAAPAEFMRDDFAEQLLCRMERFSVAPAAIEIEVTEHVFFDRASHYVGRALRVLHAAGVSIALDDFGTGYSSLSHLRDFPVNVVKIDQSFVAKMVRDTEVKAIVSAVVDLAGNLKLQVVAEGIETVPQKDMLTEMRCLFGQGHLFGRAVHADEVPHVLRR